MTKVAMKIFPMKDSQLYIWQKNSTNVEDTLKSSAKRKRSEKTMVKLKMNMIQHLEPNRCLKSILNSSINSLYNQILILSPKNPRKSHLLQLLYLQLQHQHIHQHQI